MCMIQRPSRALQSCHRSYTDSALLWARQHASVALQCLNPPLLREDNAAESSVELSSSLPRDFADFWTRRRWKFPVQHASDLTVAQSLVTHVLSAPLTLAASLLHHDGHISPLSQHWCCIGARAEASLPVEYWKETLIVYEWTTTSPVHLVLDFVGPDMQARPPITLTHGRSSLELRWSFSGKFHDYYQSQTYDACVLLNPGIAHENLMKSWEPTLDVLLNMRTTLLFTAHSVLDAEREATLLRTLTGQPVPYKENRFASQITYEDPFDARHFVRPNHCVALVTTH